MSAGPIIWHPAPASDDSTSQAAADEVTNLMARRIDVLRLVAEADGGLTADEVGQRLPGYAQSGITARLWELKKAGLVIQSERVRPTRRGRRARVYLPTMWGQTLLGKCDVW